RPALVGAVGPNRAAVTIDDRFHDPQSQAQSAGLGLLLRTAIEAFEDRTALDLGHARAFVLDPDRHLVLLFARTDSHDAAFGSELARVREQVHEHLRQARTVAIDALQRIRDVYRELLAALHEQ